MFSRSSGKFARRREGSPGRRESFPIVGKAFPVTGNLPESSGIFPNHRERLPDFGKGFPVIGRAWESSGIFSRLSGELSRLRETIPGHRESFSMVGSSLPVAGNVLPIVGNPSKWLGEGKRRGLSLISCRSLKTGRTDSLRVQGPRRPPLLKGTWSSGKPCVSLPPRRRDRSAPGGDRGGGARLPLFPLPPRAINKLPLTGSRCRAPEPLCCISQALAHIRTPGIAGVSPAFSFTIRPKGRGMVSGLRPSSSTCLHRANCVPEGHRHVDPGFSPGAGSTNISQAPQGRRQADIL
jgi:hypothetical protein